MNRDIQAGLLLGLAIGMVAGAMVTQHEFRKECIAAGVAEWEVNEKTGERTFEFRSKE